MANFTTRAIRASFLKLLNERPLNKISVRDIVEDCGINRNSFYYHYQDIPALLEEVVTEQADELVRQYPTVETLDEGLHAAFLFTMNNKQAVYHIYNSINRDVFERYLLRICHYAVSTYLTTVFSDCQVSASDREILTRFIKCEVFGMVIDWLEGGMQGDAVEDLDRLLELCRGVSEQIIARSRPAQP